MNICLYLFQVPNQSIKEYKILTQGIYNLQLYQKKLKKWLEIVSSLKLAHLFWFKT